MKIPFKLKNDKNTRMMLVTIICVIVVGSIIATVIGKNNTNKLEVIRGGSVDAQSQEASPSATPVINNGVEESKEIFVHVKGEVLYPGVYKMNSNSRVNDVINMAGGVTENANINGLNLALHLVDEQEIIVPSIHDDEKNEEDGANEVIDLTPPTPTPTPQETDVYSYNQNTSENYVPTQGATSGNSGSYKPPKNNNNSTSTTPTVKPSPRPSTDNGSQQTKPSAPPSPKPSQLPPPSQNNRVNINTASAKVLDTLPGIGEALAQRIIDYRQNNGAFTQIADIMNVSGIGQKTFEKLANLICV